MSSVFLCSCCSSSICILCRRSYLSTDRLDTVQSQQWTSAFKMWAKPVSEAIVPVLESPGSQTQVHLCWWNSLMHDEQGENVAALKALHTQTYLHLYVKGMAQSDFSFLHVKHQAWASVSSLFTQPMATAEPLWQWENALQLFLHMGWPILSIRVNFAHQSVLTQSCKWSCLQVWWFIECFCFWWGFFYCCGFFFSSTEKASVLFWKPHLAFFPRYHLITGGVLQYKISLINDVWKPFYWIVKQVVGTAWWHCWYVWHKNTF